MKTIKDMGDLPLEEIIRIQSNVSKFLKPEQLAEILNRLIVYTFPTNLDNNLLELVARVPVEIRATLQKDQIPPEIMQDAQTILKYDCYENVVGPHAGEIKVRFPLFKKPKVEQKPKIDVKTYKEINDYIESANYKFRKIIRSVQNEDAGKIVRYFKSHLGRYRKNQIKTEEGKEKFWGFVWTILVHPEGYINRLLLALREDSDIEASAKYIAQSYDRIISLERKLKKRDKQLEKTRKELEGLKTQTGVYLKRIEQERIKNQGLEKAYKDIEMRVELYSQQLLEEKSESGKLLMLHQATNEKLEATVVELAKATEQLAQSRSRGKELEKLYECIKEELGRELTTTLSLSNTIRELEIRNRALVKGLKKDASSTEYSKKLFEKKDEEIYTLRKQVYELRQRLNLSYQDAIALIVPEAYRLTQYHGRKAMLITPDTPNIDLLLIFFKNVLDIELEHLVIPNYSGGINKRVAYLTAYDFVLGLNLIDQKLITSLQGQLSFRFVYGDTVAEIFEKLALPKIQSAITYNSI